MDVLSLSLICAIRLKWINRYRQWTISVLLMPGVCSSLVYGRRKNKIRSLTGCSAWRMMRMVNRKGLVCLSGVSTLEQVVRNKVKQARLLHLGCVPNVFCKRTERTTGISNRDSVTS